MCWYPVSRALEVGGWNVVVVVAHQAVEVKREVSEALSDRPLQFALQAEQRGTGHAVACAQQALKEFRGAVLILYGDVPLITAQTLQRLLEAYRAGPGPLALVSCVLTDPSG